MTAQAIWARLRALARQHAGRTVYRPTKPAALFVCDQPPEAASEDWQVFQQKGQWYYTPSVSLLQREGLLPSLPSPSARVLLQTETEHILHTCAVRCLRETAPEQDPELLMLCLYHLAFGQTDALARALPGVIARRLRDKQPLSRAAGTLIIHHLISQSS